jgi:predicted amino acid-binding ACT domain protein
MAADRKGIVHHVALAISQLDGDLEDISQTVLRGHFVMMLLASFPQDVTAAQVVDALDQLGAQLDLEPAVSVKPLASVPTPDDPATGRDVYVLTASGADRIGFVAAVAGFCADNQMNILDLETRAVNGSYLMLLQVDLRDVDPRAAQTALAAFSKANNLRTTLQHSDVFQATQELRMPNR